MDRAGPGNFLVVGGSPHLFTGICLRSDSGGVRDQVFESTNLIPSMGWGSLVPD